MLAEDGDENHDSGHGDESNQQDGTSDSDEEELDHVVPNKGEELDDDIYADEGYGHCNSICIIYYHLQAKYCG